MTSLGISKMWTLILYTALVATSPSGGVSSTTTTLSFDSKELCDTALNSLLAVPTMALFDKGSPALTSSIDAKKVAVFHVFGHCVANSKPATPGFKSDH
jgi:hypothetical protein